MAKFQSLKYKRDLKNAQHFAFIQAFITALTAMGFTAARIVAKLAELVTAFGVEAQNGLRLDDMIAQLTDMGYSGLEKLSLIPGEVGASAVQNVGAYGVEAKDVIERVYTIDVESGKYCESCKNNTAAALAKSIEKPKMPEAPREKPKRENRMRFLEK